VGYYWTYYAVSLLAAFAVRNPWACGVVLIFFALRRWQPDPVVLLRSLSRLHGLKTQAHLNAANLPVRRDLGRAYLDLLRPRAALKWLDEARALDPRDLEIAYLRGLALLRLHDHERALRAFAAAVGIDPDAGEPFSDAKGRPASTSNRRYGDAYLAAATALEHLERWEQAEEALAMSAACNSSAMEPLIRLARVRRKRGNEAGARVALEEARRTWSQLPAFMRRKQVGWRIRAAL
jgi:tetratricopeptide (TPR) repeat protein